MPRFPSQPESGWKLTLHFGAFSSSESISVMEIIMQYNRFQYKDFDIVIAGDKGRLSNLIFGFKERPLPEIPSDWIFHSTSLLEAKNQIIQYLEGERKSFDLQLNPKGTTFQKKVWKKLQKIPYGTTISYKELASAIDNSKASRAVGSANGKNPLPIIIPCHRVIANNGTLAGYAYGTDCKQFLIELERLNHILKILQDHYNVNHWWPGDSPFEIMIGAVLTQNTTWVNVEKALRNFDDQLSPHFIENLPHDKLAEIIKPCGYYNQKAKTLKNLTTWFAQFDYNVEEVKKSDDETLHRELLSLKGIGPETADSILLYAFNKPFFVIDAYTRRVLTRLGFGVPKAYEALRSKIENMIEVDHNIYGNYHGCIVNFAKEYCLTNPRCELCPLTDHCPKLT